jgi:hypothetical protein
MSRKASVRLACAFASLFLLLFAARLVKSCADVGNPFDDFSAHPDVPLEKFAAGRLGLVKPSFARSYLVVAYRYVATTPLTRDEQFAASALWHDRLEQYSYYGRGNSVVIEPKNPYFANTPEGPQTWFAARSKVVVTPGPQINQIHSLDPYSGFLNCANDAFATAAKVLADRAATFGKDHPGVQAWVAAQDMVFSNCRSDSDKSSIPPPPESSLPEILRFDREYQVAAAYMYGDHTEKADQSFRQIAVEKSSPWRELASYLVARNMIRSATLDAPDADSSQVGSASHPDFETGKMEKAATFIRGLLATPGNERYATQLQALLDRAEFRVHPEAQQLYLSQKLSKPAPNGRFYQWLWDYTLLLDQRGDTRHDYADTGDPKDFAASTPDRQHDDLTDWIVTFQMPHVTGAAHALAMWRAHPDSLPWLLAILSKTETISPYVPEVLAAADRIPQNSPAYITAFYHRMRIRNANKNYKEVRQTIDALLAAPLELPATARQDILDLRLDAAGDLNDAIPFLVHEQCDLQRNASPCMPALSLHGATYLNNFPLDVLVSIVRHPKLDPEVQTQIARNIWLRAVLLGRHDAAQSLDSFVQNPAAFPGNPSPETIAQWVKQYESSKTPDEKQFAAVFLLQHQLAVGISVDSNQPWCASPYAFDDDTSAKRPIATVLPDSPFLTEAQRQQAAAERTSLDNLDSQANYYAKTVLDFAEKHPDDPRVPEALSRAIKNTRMNCNNKRTGPLSERAFNLLHHRCPDTPWAKNTKYWYGENPY